MTEAYLQMPLNQMVDYVINSPEEGIVNFNLLHTVLQVLVKKVNAEDLSVELHGENAKRLQGIIRPGSSPKVNITEVTTKRDVDTSGKPGKKDVAIETILVVEQMDAGVPGGMTVTKNQLDLLCAEVEVVKEKIKELTDLPGNMGIIDAVRSASTSNRSQSAVVDMYQMLSLSKRVDAAEIGMKKLASIVEDVIKGSVSQDGACPKIRSKRETYQDVKKPQARKSDESEESSLATVATEMPKSMGSDDAIAYLTEEVLKLKKFFDAPAIEDRGTREDGDWMSMAEMTRIVKKLKIKFLKDEHADEGDDDAHADLPADAQLTMLEERFRKYNKHVERMDQTFNDELSKLHNQFTDIEKDFNEILLKIEGGMPAGDKGLDEPNQCCAAVYQKIVKLQAEFEALADTSAKLLEDKEQKQKRLDELLEQIEMLKTVKADKEDIEEALADKADVCTVHRKVSHAQFDSACDELSRSVEEALGKLTQQELLWQQALDDIQSEIGNKLDRMDLGPLREFINNKLKMLQEKMKSLAALKKEQEAAGTKSKFLRNVNCISCDKDVVMRKEMDTTLRPPAYKVPPSRSMGPYLAYELDALRQQQKGIPGAKNLNNVEAAITGPGIKKRHASTRFIQEETPEQMAAEESAEEFPADEAEDTAAAAEGAAEHAAEAPPEETSPPAEEPAPEAPE